MTLSEISDRIGLAKTTCLRLLQSLEAAGYIVRVSDRDHRYCLSLKLLDLARNVDSTLNIRTIAHQKLHDLVAQTGETVSLNMRDGFERICIDVALPDVPLMRVVKTGERVPLPLGAIGRVLVAYCDDTDIEKFLAKGKQKQNVDRTKFIRKLRDIRKHGYDIAFGERIPGTTAIAAPIFDGSGAVEFCLCVLGPSVRMDDEKNAIIEKLTTETRKISLQLGYAPKPKAT